MLDIFHLHRDERQTKNESVSLCGSQNNESEISSFNLITEVSDSFCLAAAGAATSKGIRAKKGGSNKKQKLYFSSG